jgi:hypothetical protein
VLKRTMQWRNTLSKASLTKCLPPSTRQPCRRRAFWRKKSSGPGVSSTRGAQAVLQRDSAAGRESRAGNPVPSNWESRSVYLGMARRPIGNEAGTIHAKLPAVRSECFLTQSRLRKGDSTGERQLRHSLRQVEGLHAAPSVGEQLRPGFQIHSEGGELRFARAP